MKTCENLEVSKPAFVQGFPESTRRFVYVRSWKTNKQCQVIKTGRATTVCCLSSRGPYANGPICVLSGPKSTCGHV